MTPYITTTAGQMVYKVCKENPNLLWSYTPNDLIRAVWLSEPSMNAESILRSFREDRTNLETHIHKPELELWK